MIFKDIVLEERFYMDSLNEVQKIYNDASDWLKFAEAKHAGLFAIWMALLTGIVSTDLILVFNIEIKIIIVIVILFGSSINLFSFVPFLNRSEWLKSNCYLKYSSIEENAVFYQSIFVRTYKNNIDDCIQEYKNILMRRGLTNLDNKLTIDYLRQIIEVSTVGTIKCYLFNLAIKYTVVAMLVAIVGLIIA